jgi:hypothetical protein
MLVRVAKTFIAGLVSIALASFGITVILASPASAAGSTAQSITLGSLPNVAQVNQSYSMSATASSGLPVAITVEGSPANVCNASQSSYFVVEAIGSCILTFEQAGDATYAAAPTLTFTVTVEGAQQIISVGPALYVQVGAAGQISASSSAGLPIQYAVVALGAPNCSVTSAGLVTGLSVGGCTVLLSARGSRTVAAAPSVNQSVWVTALPEQATLPSAPPSVTPDPPAGSGGSSIDSGDIVFMIDQEATKKLKPSLDAKDVQSTTGGRMVFKGRNLLSIEKVFIGDNIPVNIVKSADAEIELELPKASVVGLQNIRLKTSAGEREYEGAVNYLAAPAPNPVLPKSVTKTLKGFKANQTSLTKFQKAAIKAFVKSVGNYKLVECRGVTKPIYMTCKYVKSIYKAGRVKVSKLSLKQSNPAAKQVRLVFNR